MTKYEKLKKDPRSFLSLTGYTLDEFCSLLPYFSKCFMEFVQNWTLEGKPRKKRKYTPYKNSAFESVEDMLLFILIYLRKASTQDMHGALFEMSQPNANKWIHRLLPILNRALSELGELPSRETEPVNLSEPVDTLAGKDVSEHFFS